MTSTNKKNYIEFWLDYLKVQKNIQPTAGFDAKIVVFEKIKYPSKKVSLPRALVIINSDRDVSVARIYTAIKALRTLLNESNTHIFVKDVGRKIPKQPFSFFLLFVAQVSASDIFYLIRSVASREPFPLILLKLFRRWIFKNRIEELILFTENNRLTEIFRHAAVAEGITITTFVHGVTSDLFGSYYQMIENTALDTKATTRFVNMAPGLPQPIACSKKIISIGGCQLYFANEPTWLAYDGSFNYDLLVVGGDSFGEPYESSVFFQNELRAISDCQKMGLKVGYAPHPRIAYRVGRSLPPDVDVIPLQKIINSSKVIVGHYSTSLFIAQLLNKPVFVFPEAWDSIGLSLQSIFKSKINSTYHLDRFLKQLQTKSSSITQINKGISLEDSIE
jgi:hypothetical protein